jgi:hypothetical protein
MLLPWLRQAVLGKFGPRKRLSRPAGKRHQPRIRPRLEILETRFAPAIIGGPNINITRFPGNQNEAAIAMDPTNTLNLFEVSNDESSASTTGGVLAGFSTDGGVTWTREFIGVPPGPLPAACCDAQAVFDDNGNLFVSYLGLAGGDILLLSTDGGQTFSVLNIFAAADQPKVSVGAGSVWVNYFIGTAIAVSGAHVGGLGSVGPFSVPQVLAGSGGGTNFGEMAIGPSGQVMVVETKPLTAGVFIGLPPALTDEGPDVILEWVNPTGVGGTFGPNRVLTVTNVGQDFTNIGATTNDLGIDSEPKLAWDRSGGTFGNRVYVVYNDAPATRSPYTDLFEQFSDDNGATWSSRIKINDNTVPDAVFLPSLAIDQSTGTLAIQFYDTRNDQGQGGPLDPSGLANDDAQLWASASFNGGVSWDKNVQISTGTSMSLLSTGAMGGFVPGGLRPLGPGDYEHSTAFFGGVWYPVWADNSNSTGDNPDGTFHQMDIFTAKVTLVPGVVLPSTSPTPTPIIPTPAPGSTGTGLIPIVPSTPPVVDPPGVRASNGANAFASAKWGAWSTGVQWAAVVSGDFNGDGMTDTAGFDPKTGQWVVSLSSGSGFTTSVWANWNPMAHWTNLHAGDFTGDGKTDIIGCANGQWWVGVSTGSSFTTSLWASWSPNVTWVDVHVADFTGAGKADITGRVLQTGEWWTGVSTGSSFSTSLWATWSPAVTWVDVNVGDFTGSGVAGITGRVSQSGQWWTGVSNGSSFATTLWATWSPNVTWVDVQVADFNGDGKADIIGRALQSGQWWVGQSTGNSFNASLWATWSPNVTWVNVKVGDFNNDGQADITGMALQSGQWWTGLSTGSSFNTSLWATWSPGVSWVDVQVGTFNGLEDIMGLASQTGEWWAGLPAISSGPTTPPPNPTPTNPPSNPTPTNPIGSVPPTGPTQPIPSPTPPTMPPPPTGPTGPISSVLHG